jgi:hypothetical protein
MKAHAMSRNILAATLLCAASMIASGCQVGAYPDNYDGDYPSADFVATAEPVYYDGHASYWYHNRWVYQNGGRWGGYGREPQALAQHRAQFGGGGRVNYGRPSTRGGGSRGGGSRGGHR